MKRKNATGITTETATAIIDSAATATADAATAIKRLAQCAVATLLMLCATMQLNAQCSAHNDAFKSGEQVVYDLYFNWKFIWKRVGMASLTTHDTVWQHKPAYRYNLLSVGSKQTDFFFKMRDTLTCYTTKELEPLYFRKGALEGKRHTIDEAWFSYQDGRSGVKQRRTWISEKRNPQEMEYTAPDGLCVFDMLSILAQARSYRAEDYQVGDKILFPMATGRKVEEQTLIYRGKQNVEANNDTTYRCLVFSFVEYDKKNKEKEVITFYISDDRNHLPIRLDMYLNFGSAKAFFKRVTGNKYPLTSVVSKK